ncbi:MAG: hypothetical protein U0271_37265 [Polyangiaceae bacterium]
MFRGSILLYLTIAGCGGSPPAAPSPTRPPPEEPDQPIPARHLEDWERQCVTAAREARGAGDAVAQVGCLTLIVENRMGHSLQLLEVAVDLDSEPIYRRVDPDGTAIPAEIPVFKGRASVGDHVLELAMTYKGVCSGIYDYCRDLRVVVKSRREFQLDSAEVLELRAIGYERGPVTTPVEQRPALRYARGKPGID